MSVRFRLHDAKPATATVADGYALYAGALDGKLRLLDAETGRELRVIDTRQGIAASNGVAGHGGAIDVGGVLVSGDQLFVLSGYGMFGQMPGNVLLVYGLAGTGAAKKAGATAGR